MKRMMTLAISILLALAVQAQGSADYRPFIEEGKTWIYEVCNPNSNPYYYEEWTETYQLTGDTLINSHNCKKLYHSRTGSKWQWELDQLYGGALFEEEGKVYIVYPKGQALQLLYDFSCKKGDSRVIGGYELEILDKLNVSYAGVPLHILIWSPKEMDQLQYNSILVEGIGSPDNDLIHYYDEWLPDSYRYKLLSCNVNGTEIFNYDIFQEVYSSIYHAYRPFIEEGKVWRTGIQPGNDYVQQFEYKFYNDTIIGGKTCKVLGKSKLEYYSPEKSYLTLDTTYVGILYEENGKVYRVNPENEEFTLIYDFISPVGMDITVLGEPLTIARREKSQEPEFKGIVTELQRTDDERSVVSWMEGVGCRSNPLESLASLFVTGLMNEILISCSIDNGEIIFLKEESLPYPSEVKKKWLDFTHVVKPRPKSPQRVSASEKDASEEGAATSDEAAEQEMLTGEYSARELFVSLKTLTGAYMVTLTDAAGEVVYRKDVQTSNVVALNTLLTDYPDGEYTLTVENAEEQYTALLSLPLVDDAVRDLLDDKSVNSKSVNGKWSDLSGRHLNSQPIRKGIYIKDGRKVLIK